MNVLCTICSDLVNQAENIYVTKCGHIFHHQCLAQWIERSKTCPQCRNKVTDKCMFRLYPTVSNENSSEDVATLQSRLDDAQLQLRQQRVKAKEKEEKLAVATADLKRQDDLLKSYEKRLVSFDSKVLALREQLELVNVQNKEMQKVKEQNDALRKNMQTLNGLQRVLNATSDDVEQMLHSYSDVRTIATFATALKRALCDSEAKKNECRDRLHAAKQQLALEKKNVADMNNKMEKLEGDLRVAQEKYDELKNENVRYTESKRVDTPKHCNTTQDTTDDEDNSSFTDNASGTDDSRVDYSKDLKRKKKAAWLNVLSPRSAKINQTRAEEAAVAKFHKLKKIIQAIIVMKQGQKIVSFETYKKNSDPDFERFLKERNAWLQALSQTPVKINQTRAEEAAVAKSDKLERIIKAVCVMKQGQEIVSLDPYVKYSDPEFERFMKENGLVHKIENSDSPYLTLKQGGGLCLAALQRAPLKLSETAPNSEKVYLNAVKNAHQKRIGETSNAISTKHSIFNKKEPLKIESLDDTIPKAMDISYDGLGGHSKPDVFPVPSSNVQSRIPKVSAKHKLKRPNPHGSQDIEKMLKKVKNK